MSNIVYFLINHSGVPLWKRYIWSFLPGSTLECGRVTGIGTESRVAQWKKYRALRGDHCGVVVFRKQGFRKGRAELPLKVNEEFTWYVHQGEAVLGRRTKCSNVIRLNCKVLCSSECKALLLFCCFNSGGVWVRGREKMGLQS